MWFYYSAITQVVGVDCIVSKRQLHRPRPQQEEALRCHHCDEASFAASCAGSQMETQSTDPPGRPICYQRFSSLRSLMVLLSPASQNSRGWPRRERHLEGPGPITLEKPAVPKHGRRDMNNEQARKRESRRGCSLCVIVCGVGGGEGGNDETCTCLAQRRLAFRSPKVREGSEGAAVTRLKNNLPCTGSLLFSPWLLLHDRSFCSSAFVTTALHAQARLKQRLNPETVVRLQYIGQTSPYKNSSWNCGQTAVYSSELSLQEFLYK